MVKITHQVISSVVSYIYQHQDPSKRYRNCHIAHIDKAEKSSNQSGFYQLTNAKISRCKKFFEEDFSLLENPETKLGVAKTELSENNRLLLSNEEAKQKLIRSLFSNDKIGPTILVFN